MKQIRLIVGVAILLSVILSGCNRSPEARRDKYIATGKQFLQKQDYGRAILQFKNAAQVMPKDPEVYYQLGLAYSDARDYNSAIIVFRKAVSLNPNHMAAQLKISQIFARTNDKELLKDAEDRLKNLMEARSVTPEMLNTLAFTELRLGNPENAVQILEQALAQSPGELTSTLLLAKTKLMNKDTKAAEEILKKACSTAPKSAEPRRFLGGFYFSQRRLPEAEAQFRQALEIDPKSAITLIDLSSLQLATGRKQDAEQTLKQAAAFDGYREVYGLFLSQEGRYEEAIREFQRLAKAAPDDRLARTRLVGAYRLANQPAEAEKVLNQVLKKNAKDMDALLQRGEMFLGDGKYIQAEADLNEVMHWQPNSAEAHYILAKLHQARGEGPSYRKELTESLQLNANLLAVRLELAQSLTANKAIGLALDVLNEAPESQKQLTPLLVQRNWTFWSAGNIAEMRKGIDQGLLREKSTDLLLQDGILKLREGNPSGARAALEEALKINPADLRSLAAINNSFAAQKQPRMAIQRVKEFTASQPKSAPAQELLGLVLLANGEQSDARAAFVASKAADPKYVKADLDLVRLDVLEGKWGDASSKLKAVLAADPGNAIARVWLGDVEAVKGDSSAALEHFRKVLESNPNDTQALNNFAYLLAVYAKRPDEALKYAEKAVELAPANPDYADTLGWVLYQRGLYGAAIQHLERAASKKGNVAWKYHLAMAYAKAGQFSSAQTTLDAALKLDSKIPEAQTALMVVKASKETAP
jgi:tetratricopeptide (TPR) repeat protein